MSILKKIYQRVFPKKAILKRHQQVFHENEKVQDYFKQEKATNRESDSKLDDYNWALYNLHYRGEIEEISKEHCISLSSGDYEFIDQQLVKKANIKPLHPNWLTIYETILKLQVTSILEMGCGNGMHLFNLGVLNPGFTLIGVDRSEEQLDFLKQLHPELQADLHLADATKPLAEVIPKTELGYTQAVIMHIQTEDNHKKASANLFNNSEKYVVLMENWKKHPFLVDIMELKATGKISWENLYIYWAPEPNTGKPYAMVCSNTPLSNFEELSDYNQLLN